MGKENEFLSNLKSSLMTKIVDRFQIYTVDEFKNVMNGTGYDNSEFWISITPFNYVEGYFLSFFHAENDQFCVVVQDDAKGIDDFILFHDKISVIFDILDSLEPCYRKITVNHENYYKES